MGMFLPRPWRRMCSWRGLKGGRGVMGRSTEGGNGSLCCFDLFIVVVLSGGQALEKEGTKLVKRL